MNRLLRRAVDVQYRVYDRVRHRQAARVAGQSGRTGPFEELGESGYLLVVTFKRSGEPVPTPVLFTHRDGKAYFRSEPNAKVKRLRANPHVRIARCNVRGKPKSPLYEGRAHELPADQHERAWRILRDGYSPAFRLYESVADRTPVEFSYVEVAPV
jgi:PPOX class probable F420-dependent enzyme